MKIKKYKEHVVLSIGKFWISFDKTGIMGWTGKRNFYWIFKK